jgi:hypothetical protein
MADGTVGECILLFFTAMMICRKLGFIGVHDRTYQDG